MKYKRISFNQVKKEIEKKGVFKGFVVGNKITEDNFFKGWNMAVNCELDSLEKAIQFKNSFEISIQYKIGGRVAWYQYL